MKKKLLGIFLLVILIISAWNSICLADVIDMEAADKYYESMFGNNIEHTFLPIGIVISLVVASSSVLVTLGNKENQKESISKRVAIIIFLILTYIYARIFKFLEVTFRVIPNFIFYIPIGILFIALITRLFVSRKQSLIILIISGVSVITIGVGMAAYEKSIEIHNEQFMQYVADRGYWMDPFVVTDIKGLISSAIKNNKSNRKVTIVLNNVEYENPEELTALLDTIDDNTKYYIDYSNSIGFIAKHDFYIESEYIDRIAICSIENIVFKDKYNDSYIGKRISGAKVLELLDRMEEIDENWLEVGIERNWELYTIYNSKLLDETASIYKTDSKAKIKKIKDDVDNKKYYKVKCNIDYDKYKIELIITETNAK